MPARLMKNWIIRIPEPIPLGDTFFRAIVRAICPADPVKVLGGGAVETVFTFPDQRLRRRFLAGTSDEPCNEGAMALRKGPRSSRTVERLGL